MKARGSSETLTPIYQTARPHNLRRRQAILMSISLLRDSQSIRSGKEWHTERLQLKPCHSFVFINLEQRLRNVWRSKRYVQHFGRSWRRSQVDVMRHKENAHALDNNLIILRTSEIIWKGLPADSLGRLISKEQLVRFNIRWNRRDSGTQFQMSDVIMRYLFCVIGLYYT
jgi:hypothetical protein